MEIEAILEKYPRATSAAAQPAPPQLQPTRSVEAKNARNRELAVQHANLIEERKGIEAENFTALEMLIDFPLSTTDPFSPSQADVAQVKKLIRAFQRSDYDDLIEERRAAGKCGYVLCPRPYKSDGRRPGQLKLVWNQHEMTSVPRHKVDIWCSKECKKMAMYIKVQLSEIPAWDRIGSDTGSLTIMGEPSQDNTLDVQNAMANLSLKKEDNMKVGPQLDTAMADLATERGERLEPGRASMITKMEIREREHVEPPASSFLGSRSMEIEGHIPKLPQFLARSDGMEVEDGAEDDNDWDIR